MVSYYFYLLYSISCLFINLRSYLYTIKLSIIKNRKKSFQSHSLELLWFLLKLFLSFFKSFFLHLKGQTSSTLKWLQFLFQNFIHIFMIFFSTEI